MIQKYIVVFITSVDKHGAYVINNNNIALCETLKIKDKLSAFVLIIVLCLKA